MTRTLAEKGKKEGFTSLVFEIGRTEDHAIL